ncbi:thioredoxin family protein [Flavobacterium sp. HSC-61S13]|uniref:thioredoxin family protein n=1 Tax=Flavobacterium sp. HSC-61S13 TaxID=2910963 RepID=UPI00209D6B61|nr:thioredoxin family protein [Flavobacterium sp. HSC-61S13]MCP1996296.1 thioredoxin-related protein [Flavobacterium sp. HSC-61S13]
MKEWIWIMGLFTCISNAQITTTTLDKVEDLMAVEARPLLIFFYTDWCSYCELMKQKTFSDSEIIKELNQNYYVIFFDGESKDAVKWDHRHWGFKKRGLKSGTHQLALYFAEQRGTVTYPAMVFLDSKFQKIYQHNSYLKASELHALLKVVY